MGGKDYRESGNKTIEELSNYFIDSENKKVDEVTVPHWNLTLTWITEVFNGAAMYQGSPGWGKSTLMKVASSFFSGYPLDLFEGTELRGDANATFEITWGRFDFSKLHGENGKEVAIWGKPIYLSNVLIDEINRYGEGMQNTFLPIMETSRVNYAGHTIHFGKKAYYATANAKDKGNFNLIPPLVDRFGVCIELGDQGPLETNNILRAEQNQQELRDQNVTTGILNIINGDVSYHQKLELINRESESFRVNLIHEKGINILNKNEKQKIRSEIESVPLGDDARFFLQLIHKDLNYTPTFVRKRPGEIDPSPHAQELASFRIKNAFTHRAAKNLRRYAQGIAYLNGSAEVNKEHILTIAPHVLGHRLSFTDRYKDENREEQREGKFGLPFDMFLAHRLVEHIEDHFEDTVQCIDELIIGFKDPRELPEETMEAFKEVLKDPYLIEPLPRDYLQKIQESLSSQQLEELKKKLFEK